MPATWATWGRDGDNDGQFLTRLFTGPAHTYDTVMARRITNPDIDTTISTLNGQIATAVIASMPEHLLARYRNHDRTITLALATITYLWSLHASDALLLPHGNLATWRYQLTWTQHQAASPGQSRAVPV